MIDEIFDRQYRSARSSLNGALAAGLSRFGQAIGTTFQVLNRIEYQSPWTGGRSRARSR